MKTEKRWIFFGCVIWVAVRLSLLLLAGARFYQVEELYSGYTALEVIYGIRAPFWHYQIDEYTGGSLWTALAAIPFLKIFGHHLFALKFVPLLSSLLAVWLMARLICRNFGFEAARMGLVLMIVGIPTLTFLSLYATGSHPDSLWIQTAALFGFLQAIDESRTKRRMRYWIGFGVLSGFAVWFSSISLILFGTCLFTLFITKKRIALKDWVILAFSFGLGLGPWWFYNLSTHFDGLFFFGDLFYSRDGQNVWVRFLLLPREFIRFFVLVLPASFGFESIGFIPAASLAWVYYGLLGSLLIPFLIKVFAGGWNKLKTEKELFFLLYPLIYVLAAGLTQYRSPGKFGLEPFAFRYLAPFLFFLIPLMSIALSRCSYRKLYLSLFCLICLLAHLPLFAHEPFGKIFEMPAFSIEDPDQIWQSNRTQAFWNSAHPIEQIQSMNEKHRHEAYMRLANASDFGLRFDADKFSLMLEKIPFQYRAYYIRKWGESQNCQVLSPDEIRKRSEVLDESDRNLYYYGCAKSVDFGIFHSTAQTLDLIAAFPPEYQKWFYFSLGGFLIEDMKKSEGLKLLDSEAVRWIFRGMGALAIRSPRDLELFLKSVSPEFKAEWKRNETDCIWGYGWILNEFGRKFAEAHIAETSHWPESIRRAFLDGWESYPREFQNLLK